MMGNNQIIRSDLLLRYDSMIHGISTKLGGNPNLFESKFVYRKNGKFFVDLKAHIRNQLQESGIQSRRIDTYPLCTYNEKDLLHSYRRDKEKSGRMFSVIGMRQ